MAVDLLIAVAAGWVATRVSDRAQRLFYRATPLSEKLREPAYPGCSSAEQAARMIVDTAGAARTRRRVARIKTAIHYGLGSMWSTLYPPLRRRTRSAVAAGVLAGTGLSLLVDEGLCPVLGITAPNRDYPISSHMRGLLTHLVYGLAVAATTEALHRALEARSSLRLARS